MATARITWNQAASTTSGGTQKVAARLANFIQQTQQACQYISELKRIIDKYNGDDTTLGTDLGAAVADATTIRNLVTQAYGELELTVSTQLNVGSTSGTRQLLDALS